MSTLVQVSEIRNPSNIFIPAGLSFFDPYLQYYLKETLEIGGEAFASRTSDGTISGLFLYDGTEKAGTIYTRSREVFDCFYKLKPFNFLFAEMSTDLENEIYDIYTTNLDNLDHRFSHEISVAQNSQTAELEQFMSSTHQGINKKWVGVALRNGDRCFTVRLGNEIAGLGWLSIVNGIGRLHSLYVKPQFRRLGMGEDILFARLFWLKSKHVRRAFSEISRYNSPSSRIAEKGGMQVSGQIFQYFKKG